MASIAEAERAQKQIRAKFGRIRGVRGIGVAWDDQGNARIRVNVDSNLSEAVRARIPSELDGVAVELRVVRGLQTFADNGQGVVPPQTDSRLRPLIHLTLGAAGYGSRMAGVASNETTWSRPRAIG